mmetsp:Transcript_29977/g.67239  ORF Transcript_29977/g.67239 Transcript_29977/m.67239 type:complete len:142 (-) Transcript_29977:190-615(-)
MGAVAMSRIGGGLGWQPGLFEVRAVSGRVTDILGLGDAVFPALLAALAARFDAREEKGAAAQELGEDGTSPPPYYMGASLAGFAAGCSVCEFAPGIDTSGLPALLFLVPGMLLAVFGLALARGELADLWEFDPANKPELPE